MDVDLPEGDLIHEVKPHHHHPGHPEKEDVEGGDQDGRGVKELELRGLGGPAQGGEGPQGRREPGVQDVGFLDQVDRRRGRRPGLPG